MTKIGVDLRVFNTGRITGIEEYTRMLLAHMVPLDRSIQYHFFVANRNATVPDEEWTAAPNATVHAYARSSRFMNLSMRLTGRPHLDALTGHPDVFFFPHFIFGALSIRCPRVLTFHDLSYERFPEFLPLRRRVWHRLHMSPRWQVRHADHLIAVSDSTARDVRAWYGFPSERLSVIHSGVDASLRRAPDEDVAAFRRTHNLPERFILSLCTFEPRKNLIGLVRAFERLAAEPTCRDVQLILAGEHGWLERELHRTVEQSPFRGRIRIVGSVMPHERALWYSAATVFAYPSFFEGFGFPPLEAMTCGTPVVAGQYSSLPEVVGDAGLLIDPYDVGSMASTLRSVLTDPELHTELSHRALARVQRFSWHRSAERTLEVLVRSAGASHPHIHGDRGAVY